MFTPFAPRSARANLANFSLRVRSSRSARGEQKAATYHIKRRVYLEGDLQCTARDSQRGQHARRVPGVANLVAIVRELAERSHDD